MKKIHIPKWFFLLTLFFTVFYIFATPLARECDMSEAVSCCEPLECECDADLSEKIDNVKQQLKTISLDFYFDYEINSVSKQIVCIKKKTI